MISHLNRFLVYYVLVALLVSCGLKQPEIIPDTNIPVGSVFVNSNIPGARIFINSAATGKVTPDTVHNVPVGSTLVQVFKDGYITTPDSIIVDVNAAAVVSAQFSLEFITNQGKVYFESTPSGAEILVDGSTTGKCTPDTVILAAGVHHFGLYKNGFDSLEIGTMDIATNSLTLFNETLIVEKQVLIESFANSSCLPCTTTNTHIENFIATHNPKDYTLIEYFTNWPNFLDPMFQHNPAGNSARFTYYEVLILPAMFVNGITVNAVDYSSIQSNYNNQLNNASQDVSISFSRQISDSLKVNVELNEYNTLPAGDWRLFIAVIEKEVVFASPPGANGLSKFSHVFRKFFTSDDGDLFNFSNNKFEKEYTLPISSEWDLNEIQIVGFIQNYTTKEVIKSSHL